MKRPLFIILIIYTFSTQSQQLYVGERALMHISDGANLEVGGDLENDGRIDNLGTLSLYGDWIINNYFNGNEGSLNLLGGENQSIAPPELMISELVVDLDGIVTFPGEEYVIADRIEFKSGSIQIGDNTEFILGESARVINNTDDSYFDGTIISIAEGTSTKIFPVGNNGVYAPLTILDVFGIGSKIAVRYIRDNERNPIPSDTLLGVSHRGLWELQLVGGSILDDSRIEIEFRDEDLSDFREPNNIGHTVNSPVIAYTDNLNEEWGSLGVSELIDTDSLSFGTITSETRIRPLVNKTYLAMGLAPLVPEEGLYFIPEIFSPNATSIDNQTFKVFGEKIVEEDFFLRIFNRLGVVVYETSSFQEASRVGWDGTNLSGGEEPTGIYYYEARLKFENDRVVEKSEAFYLVR